MSVCNAAGHYLRAWTETLLAPPCPVARLKPHEQACFNTEFEHYSFSNTC